jgi:DNA-directed RNA polymerase specialized sigma24 family protein
MGTAKAPGRKKDRELTQAEFDMLLAEFDSDRDEAGKKYVEVRRRLVKFLGLWGCSDPDEQADEAMSRTARKIFEGERIEKLNAYLLGTANLVYKETVREEISQRNAMSLKPPQENHAEEEGRQKCYKRCLRGLPAEEHDLMLRYYQWPKPPDRIKLADQMGISLNLLRVSAFRIRKKLGDCLQECLKLQSEL